MFYLLSLFLFWIQPASALEAWEKTLDVEVAPDDGTHHIRLTWTHHPDATGYRIFRRVRGGDVWNPIWTADGAQSEYIDTDVSEGRAYIYRVQREVAEVGVAGTLVMAGHEVMPQHHPIPPNVGWNVAHPRSNQKSIERIGKGGQKAVFSPRPMQQSGGVCGLSHRPKQPLRPQEVSIVPRIGGAPYAGVHAENGSDQQGDRAHACD